MLLVMNYHRASVSPTHYRGIAGSGDEIASREIIAPSQIPFARDHCTITRDYCTIPRIVLPPKYCNLQTTRWRRKEKVENRVLKDCFEVAFWIVYQNWNKWIVFWIWRRPTQHIWVPKAIHWPTWTTKIRSTWGHLTVLVGQAYEQIRSANW